MNLVNFTRPYLSENKFSSENVLKGLDTYSAFLLLKAAQAHALLNGKKVVSNDDVLWVAPYLFFSRLVPHTDTSYKDFLVFCKDMLEKACKSIEVE